MYAFAASASLNRDPVADYGFRSDFLVNNKVLYAAGKILKINSKTVCGVVVSSELSLRVLFIHANEANTIISYFAEKNKIFQRLGLFSISRL